MYQIDTSPVGGTTKKYFNMDLMRDYFLKYTMFDLYEKTEESIDRILVNADILIN